MCQSLKTNTVELSGDGDDQFSKAFAVLGQSVFI